MGNIMSSSDSTLPRQQTNRERCAYYRTTSQDQIDYTTTKRCYFEDDIDSNRNNDHATYNNRQQSPTQENSRMLFLLYLIHRTWNVVVDSVDQKGKK